MEQELKTYIISISAEDGCEIEYNLSESQYELIEDICNRLKLANESGYCGKIKIELKD